MTVIKVDELTSLYIKIAEKLGAPKDEAEIFARCMVRADLRGMFTQGASMIPYSVMLIETRVANFGVPFTILKDEAGMALIDGHHGVGAVVATRAMDLAIAKARTAGVGCVWVRNGGDFMMTANHALQAMEQDMVGLVMRNENPRVAPWGGMEPFFFTNPIAVAFPSGQEPPVVIDMAGASFSVGMTVMAARDNKRMPSPHLVTKDGEYTDDPRKIVVDPADRESGFTGGIVTLGHKGLMWAIIVELFSALLAGTNTSNLNNFAPTGDHPWDEGQFHMAIDVSKLQPLEQFKAATDGFIQALRSVKPAQGFERVMIPGEVEARNEQTRLKEGIPIRDEVWQLVLQVADRLGVSR
jgi:L-2-hydroxycarboxylate dehydrogenase (NAD+)